MLAFDAKRAFMNTSGLGNYSRTHILNLRTFLPGEKLLLLTPKVKIPFIEESQQVIINTPKGLFNNAAGAAYWRSYRVAEQAEYYDAKVFHGLSNELPLNVHKYHFKKIVSIHDLIFEHYPAYYRPWDRKTYHTKVRYATKHADLIVCISEQTADDLRGLYKVPAEKIEVIYQDCSKLFHQQAEQIDIVAAKEKYGIGSDYVICLGTPEPRKKQNSLVEAVSILNPDVEIIFIGRKNNYQTEIEKLIVAKKLQNRIRFINDVHTVELPALLKGALCSAYLSEYEGFGLPIIESLNQGTPVLSSNRSCLPEAAGPGALYVDPENTQEVAEGLRILLNDSSLRFRLGAEGSKHVLKFRAGNTIEQWKKAYSI